MTRTPRQGSSLRKPARVPEDHHYPGTQMEVEPGQMRLPAIQDSSRAPMLLTARHAWALLYRKTGASLSRTTFYRWLREGRILTVRMGYRLYVPVGALEEFAERCLAGERA